MPTYTYAKSSDAKLEAAIQSSTGIVPDSVAVTPQVLASVSTQNALDAYQLEVLDQFFADRDYVRLPYTPPKFVASSKLTNGVTAHTNDAGYDRVGGVATNPLFFGFPLSYIVGRASFLYRATGSGAKVKIVEDDLAGNVTDLTSVPVDLPDTGGQWAFHDGPATTDLPPNGGTHDYSVKITRGGAQLLETMDITLVMIALGF